MDAEDCDIPFQGREEFLEDFLNAWKDNNVVFGVFGMRAVGKSRAVKKHIDDVQKMMTKENNQFRHMEIINVDMRFLKTSKQLYVHMCALLDILPDPSYDGQHNAWCQQTESHIRQCEDQFFIVLFDNCEDVMDSELKDVFLSFVVTLAKIRHNIRVYITSTTQILFKQIRKGYFYKTLEPMNQLESKKLLRVIANTVDFGEHLDKIVELCGGLPLVLLMVGSELDADEGMLKPEDMVELLTECRLRALSREFYPKEDRIVDVYKEFILRLSEVFQQRLATLGYIPGSFTARHVKEMLGYDSVACAKIDALIPMKRKNFISYDSKTERFDIHGILRDCISVYICIKNIPAVRKRFCKTFSEEMKKITCMMSTADYTEALDLFALENPNLHKFLTDVLYTQYDTYHCFIEVASMCSSLLENFMAPEGEKFYKGCLKMTQQYGKPEDEAVVKMSYGSLLTNAKGDAIGGEQFYCQTLEILKNNPQCEKLAELHQKFGWNLYIQGRAEESIRHLRCSMEIVQKLGQDRTNLYLQAFRYLAIIHTFVGDLNEAERYHQECFRLHRNRLSEENIKRVHQKKKQITEDEMPEFGILFNNLGVFYQRRLNNEMALHFHEKGLNIKRKFKVPVRSLLMSMNNVAADYSLFGMQKKAIELLKEAEYIALRTSPLNEINLGIIYDTLGKVLIKNGDFCKAREYLGKVVVIRANNMARSSMHAEGILHLAQAEMKLKHFETATNLAENLVSMKIDLIKNQPQISFISEALECLLDICIETGVLQELQGRYEALEDELQRMILFHKINHNERLVQHLTKRLLLAKERVLAKIRNESLS